MASSPNHAEIPSFYWDSVNKTKITNFSLVLGFIQIPWKTETEPKQALQNKMAIEGSTARLPAAQRHPRPPGRAGEHRSPPDALHQRATWEGRVHRGDAETLQRNGLWFCPTRFADAFNVNNFANAIGQIGFWVEREDAQ